MRIRQSIFRVFAGLAALLAVLGLVNLLMMQRVILRGETVMREVQKAERLAAELNRSLGDLAAEMRADAGDEVLITSVLSRLQEISGELTEGGGAPSVAGFCPGRGCKAPSGNRGLPARAGAAIGSLLRDYTESRVRMRSVAFRIFPRWPKALRRK